MTPCPHASLPLRDPEDPSALLAVIEASRGSVNKLKFDPVLGVFKLDGVLAAGHAFPLDFGFLPRTLGADGDPLDVLVIQDEAVPPGTVVPCRLLGVIEATQRPAHVRRAVRNDRLVAVAIKSRRHGHCRTLADVPASLLDDVEHFFVSFNAAKGGTFRVLRRAGPAVARALVRAGEVAA